MSDGPLRGPWPAAPAPGDRLATAVANAVLLGTALPTPTTGSLRAAPGGERLGIPHLGPRDGERSVGVDETNTSIIVGDRVVVKFVADGGAERSDRMLRALTGTHLTPAHLGSVEWDRGDGAPVTVALVGEYLPGRVDGWTWAVDDVLRWIDGGPPPAWPTALGARTAELHAVLGRDARQLPVDADALRRDAARAVHAAQELGHPDDTAGLRRLGDALRDLTGIEAALFPLHGDLHVGQFLREPEAPAADASSYAVIDFDGDPQQPADAAEPAAKDIAHLRVSAWAVAAVAARRRPGEEGRLAEWAGRAGAELLGAYRGRLAAQHPPLLPDTPGAALLLAHYELEQIAREVTYAARYLPAFAYASRFMLANLDVLLAVTGSPASRTTTPPTPASGS